MDVVHRQIQPLVESLQDRASQIMGEVSSAIETMINVPAIAFHSLSVRPEQEYMSAEEVNDYMKAYRSPLRRAK
ncbi:hypothetical protein KFE25_000742 [Diacronema lutheri]|uniref:Uncharacterized protein n=1 Tax=Diacronema lutheri TaxID=2081491 RepID=A0A8J5XEQ3_DIALT|nr:hypothetical protein KFE25_000742 [Diacronema lutheri]